jgi:hypothetical protein
MESEFNLNQLVELKALTREQLTEEILADQRAALDRLNMDDLRAHVITQRVTLYKRRLAAEAGLVVGALGDLYRPECE